MSTTTDIETYQKECIGIIKEDLDTEFCRVPTDASFWAERFSEAWASAEAAEHEYDQVRARTFMAKRASKVDGKQPSVDDAKALTDSDLDVVTARTAHIEAEAEKIRVKGVLDAVCSKRDMLQSLGAAQRAERGFSMRAKKEEDWG